MARRRKDHGRGNHSPFKPLKGLSCAGPPRQSPESPLVPTAEPLPAVPEGDDSDLFSREMEWLEVRPLPGSGGAVPAPAEDAGADEFLAAVDRLDLVSRDELPANGNVPHARPRRMKQLERGDLRPGGELDLHGLHRDAATARTRAFLAHAVRQGWPVVLIVTGKGLHSPGEPVLRRAVERLLDDARDLVVEWGDAPRRYGGAGVLAVFLRVAGNGGTGA